MVDCEKSKPQHVVILMRHGERVDLTVLDRFKIKDWTYKDPVITPDGCKQAHLYGRQLKAKFISELEAVVGGPFDEVKIQTSPYLRTMMTAANVAQGLGYAKPIETNYMFAEY